MNPPPMMALLDSALLLQVGDPAVPIRRGTGFIYFHTQNIKDDGTRTGPVWVITTKHLLEGMPPQALTTFRVNAAAENNGDALYGKVIGHTFHVSDWHLHPDADVAVLPLTVLEELIAAGANVDAALTNEVMVTRENAYAVGAYEGARVLIVGFPSGYRPAHMDFSVVRDGVIGESRGWMTGAQPTILVSGSTYPGNSGSPVILDPWQTPISENGSPFRLLGMAIGASVQEPDAADPRRIVDLAHVVPIETIQEFLDTIIAAVRATSSE